MLIFEFEDGEKNEVIIFMFKEYYGLKEVTRAEIPPKGIIKSFLVQIELK